MNRHTLTLTSGDTADPINTVRVLIAYDHPARMATVEAWPEMYSRDEAEKKELLASAHFDYRTNQRREEFEYDVEAEAAMLGMDTLRHWSRPLYREPDTRGDW